ncbi:MAG: phosphopyruvate hydratase [Gammaproteobacteria bacterium]|nr:phosphopyruvate hydratase [Gammaproteobacteria bacterium]
MSVHEILSVTARRVWDSRGHPTVEAEVRLRGGARGRGIAPAGASTGRAEAVDLRDRGKALQGLDVQSALANVRGEIARALKGMDVRDQRALDSRLCDLDGTDDKRRLGANATVAVSMAAAHAAAAVAGMPLWRWLAGGAPVALPLPEIQIYGGGAHAGRRIDIQDLMVVAIGARSFDQALEWTAEIYAAAGQLLADAGRRRGVADEGGYWPEFDSNEQALEYLVRAIETAGFRPGEDVAIALDIAASELGRGGRYRLALEREELDGAALAERIEGWTRRFPIVSVEDPLGEDDEAGLAALTARLGARVQVVGDDFLVSDAARVRAAAAAGACNAVLLKPNQAGTLSEIRDTLEAAREAGWGAIVSARSGETEDVTIVHLAVGWSVPQLKVGSFARSERMAKWNEALRIEESLGEKAVFAGARALARGRAHG